MPAQIFGINSITILSILIAVTAGLVILTVWSAMVTRNPVRGRLKSLNERKDALRAGLTTSHKRQRTIKRVDSVGTMRKIADRFKLMQSEQTKKISIQLSQAGFRSKDSIVVYQFFRLIMPALGGVLAVIIFYGFGAMADSAFRPLIGMTAVLFFYKIPDIYITNAKQKRTEKLRLALPDALDLMVVCAEAGLTLDATMSRVAKELGRASPELADEFSLTSIELSFMSDRRIALMNLAERVDLPAIGAVITTLVQSERYGTPLAAALRVLSAEFRNDRMMAAEEKAARLPAILTVPLILFILPTLFVVLLGPATCQVSDNFIK